MSGPRASDDDDRRREPAGTAQNDVAGESDGRRPGGSPDAAAPPGPRADELIDLLRRERADFVNYRRRIAEERAADRERAQAEAIERLLPLVDELDRALTVVPDELEEHPWARGVAMSHRRLLEALQAMGVERIGLPGERFDPERHEALFYAAGPDESEARVAAVLRSGYRLGNRLLRPAQVSVVGPPEAEADARPHASAEDQEDTDRRAAVAQRSRQHQAGG
jgi:molecular chaperone GrpE